MTDSFRFELLKKINILGIDYEIKEVDCIDDDSTLMGLSNRHTGVILLKKSVNKDIKKQVLIHEVLHALLPRLGLYDLDKEEIVEALSSGLYQVLVSNDLLKGGNE